MATITSLTFRLNTTYNGQGLRQARQDIAGLDAGIRTMSKAWQNLVPGMQDVMALAVALGPALVPIAGGLLAIGTAAGSAFLAGGAAVGIFGAALAGAIKTTVGAGSAFSDTNKAVDKARKALDDTVPGTKEYTKANKALTEALKAHEDALKAMPPVQEAFARTFEKSKGAMMAFNEANAQFTLGPATTMLEAFIAALPKFNGVIRAVSPEIQRVADLTKRWVTDGGLDRFLAFVIKYGVPALRGFVDAMRSLFSALGTGMRDTAPLGMAFTKWLVDTMATFKAWADGGGFERFLQWISDNKGELIQALKDLGTFLANVGKAVAGMSGSAFVVLGTFFKVLASFPPGLLQAMMYGFIGLTVAMRAYAAVMLIVGAAQVVMALTTGTLGIMMIGVAVSIGLVILALVALAVGIYFLVKHWDTVMGAIKSTAQTVWGWLTTAWEATWNAIKGVVQPVWNFLTNGWGQVLLLFMGPLGLLVLVWKHWDTIWGSIKNTAATVWQWMKDTWSSVTGWFLTAWRAVSSPIMESWNAVWPQMREAAMNVWNALKTAWSILWTGAKIIWESFWSIFGPAFRAAWEGASSTASATWNVIKNGWQLLWTIIQAIYQTAWAILKGAWDVGWSALTGAARIAWSILTGAWEVVWSVVRGVWDTFYATFSAIFRAAWNTIVAVATGIWNVIKAAWDALWKTVTAIFTTFLAIFTGNWGQAWNSIKDAAAAIWNLIKTSWQAFLNVLRSLLDGFINIVKAAWQAFWTAVQNTATTFWNALRNLFQTSLTAVQNLWNTVWNAVRTIFQTIVNGVLSIAQTWWSAVRALFQAGLTFLQGLWNTVWTTIRQLFTTAVAGLRASAEQLWTWLREIFNAGSNWLRVTFWNPVRDFFTKTIPSAFETAKNALGKAWDGIRKLVRDPIQAIVNVVYNNGIVKLWNLVAGTFGADKLSNFTLPAFAEGGPTGTGSKRGFPAILHPNEHVWTAEEVAGAGGHEAVAKLRQQAMRGARVRTYGEHSFEDGGGFLGTGIGPDIGPDLVPDGIIKNAIGKLKDLALGAISGPFGAAVDGVAKLGKAAVRAATPGSNTGMEKLGVGMIDKIATTIKNWVKEHDVAPEIAMGGNGFVPWAAWKAGDGTRQNYGGVTVNRRTAAMLNNAVKIAKTAFQMFQGSYSNAVAASGGTHSGGGAVDLGPAKDSIVGAMRASGFAAWRRTPAEGFSPHIHGIAVGDPTVSAAAAAQIRAFNAGRNGLANNGPDTYTAPGGTSGKSVSAAKATGKNMLAGYGWSSHWSALEALWNRESGWRWNADNPTSDAYGIPQALPGSKMASAGADWKTNPATQIRWGLGYIKSRYGNPTKANNFQKANNWYGRGTRDAHPGWGVVGDNGIEIMRMRGGEDIRPLESLVRGSGGPQVNVTLHIDARGATAAAVDKLKNEFPDRLRMALEQGIGSKP